MEQFFKSKLNIALVVTIGAFLFFALLQTINTWFMFVALLFFVAFMFLFSFKIQLKHNELKNKNYNDPNLSNLQIMKLERQKKVDLRSYKIQFVSLYILTIAIFYYVLSTFIF